MRHLAAAIVLLAAGRVAGATPLPAEVLGTWVLSEAAAEVVPSNCRSVTLQFDSTTVTETHGAMVLKTTYELASEGPPWTLRRVVTAYTARPNCIGTVMPFALGQRIADLRIELLGDRLRLHLIQRRGSPLHIDLVRPGSTAGPPKELRPGSPAP